MTHRILYISSRGNIGAGGETYLMSVLRFLDRSRFTPIVVIPNEGTLRTALEALDVQVVLIGGNYGWLKPADPWYGLLDSLQRNVHQLARTIQDESISLVHTNSNFRLEGAMAARLAGVHHLYLAHIEFQPEMPIFQRFPITQASYAKIMGELSSQVIAVSESVAATLQPMIPAEKISVVHNGIELEAIDAAAARGSSLREELGLPQDAVLATAIGRMNPDKGFDLFVEAAGKVLQKAPNAHFLLVGGEEVKTFESGIRQRVEELEIGRNFHFLGHRKDVPSILRQSDIFVLSSRREGHPYVMLEAMACKCAITACACAGVNETLTNGETGFTQEIGDIDGIAGTVLKLINDTGLRLGMANAARKQIEDNFQARQTAARLVDVYDDILSRQAPPLGSPSIDIFLQAATEIGGLGKHLVDMEQRLKKMENLALTLTNNPASRGLRVIKQRLFSSRK